MFLCKKHTEKRRGGGVSSGRMKPHLRFSSLSMCSNFVVFWWVPYLMNRFWSRNMMFSVFTKPHVFGFWQPHKCQRSTDHVMNIVADVNMFYWYCCCAFMHTYPALECNGFKLNSMSFWLLWDLTSLSSPAILETCRQFGNSSQELFCSFSSVPSVTIGSTLSYVNT